MPGMRREFLSASSALAAASILAVVLALTRMSAVMYGDHALHHLVTEKGTTLLAATGGGSETHPFDLSRNDSDVCVQAEDEEEHPQLDPLHRLAPVIERLHAPVFTVQETTISFNLDRWG